jgi:uroporphyrinogen decarboxylase
LTQLKNDRFLKALAREAVDVTPVWMMRQAGRYLPEYRALREKAGGFLKMCQNPQLACEISLQPIERFPLDVTILFSDILTIPDAMGLGLYFTEGEGPRFKKPVHSEADVNNLQVVNTEKDLTYVTDAVRLIRKELNGRTPLLGFSGSPWTLATYMVEGGPSKEYQRIKSMIFNQPEVAHQLLEKLSLSVIDYLNAQIKAGAQAVQIFDTWGGILSHQSYLEFSLQYMEKIVKGLIKEHEGRKVPVILFTKNGGLWIDAIANSGCDALGLDWTIDIGKARAQVGNRVALQGNLDPGILYAKPERIRAEVKSILASYGKGNGHVFNLGHGITPGVNPEHAAAFINAVHELSEPYHQ